MSIVLKQRISKRHVHMITTILQLKKETIDIIGKIEPQL